MLGIAASIWPQLLPIWWGFGGIWLLAMIVDGVGLLLAPRVIVSRNLPDRMALGLQHDVSLTVQNSGRRTVAVRVLDGLPPALVSGDWPWEGTVPGGGLATITARIRATLRGPAEISPAFIEQTSPMGLWTRRYRAGLAEILKVYPNYEPVIRLSLLAMQHHEPQMGIRHSNKAGMSREFRQLRDYQDGDPMNGIDWKATSRRLCLISREYEEQRNQTIIFMADCGRRLHALDGGLSQFDHCLNAILLVSFIALRQGDRVGVMSYGGEDRWLPPVTGAAAMPVLLNHLYDYQTSNSPGDVSEAVESIMRRQQRRALVIFCTNLRSEDATHLLKPLKLLRRRHLVVIASLKEEEIIARMEKPIATLADALSNGAANQYLEDRRLLLETLRREGILTIDAPAAALPVALGNLYMEIKKQGRL